MKIKALATALLAAAAAPSFALVPGAEGNSNPVLHVYGTGATAIDKQLKLLSKTICRAGTLDIFSDDVTKPEGNKYSAFYCVVGPAEVPGLTATYNIMIHKNSNGGSFNGVGPVATSAIEDQMVIQTGAGFCGVAAAGSDAGTPVWACNKANVDNTQAPDFGVSDVEPALWAKLGQTFPAANLVTSAMNGNTFGIPVTVALRNALQTAQGLPSGSELGADQPNLSRSDVASILQGNITSWDQFKVNGVALPAAALVAPVNKRVQICRRVNTSGTQAQANVFFNAFPCSGTAGTGSLADNSTFSTTADGKTADDNLNPLPATKAIVHEHDGSGGVTDCLNVLQDANAWAVGIQSLEKNSSKFRFVKIDGALPTLKNVANNTYGEWFTSAITWRSAASGNAPVGDKLKVLELIRNDASNPTILAQINQSFSQPFTTGPGEVGLVALPYKPSVTNKVFSIANPVATASREGKTGTVAADSCRTPVIFGDAEITKAD